MAGSALRALQRLQKEETKAVPKPAPRAVRTPAEVGEMPLDTFASAGLVVRVASKVLGETVLFVSDNVRTIPTDLPPGLVVYRASELVRLVDVPPGIVQALHAAKKAFPGSVLTESANEEPVP